MAVQQKNLFRKILKKRLALLSKLGYRKTHTFYYLRYITSDTGLLRG